MIYLETPRLILRDYQTGDLKSLFGLLNNAKAMAYLPDLYAGDIETAQLNLDYAMSSALAAHRQAYFLAVIEKATGQLVGSCGFEIVPIVNYGSDLLLSEFVAEVGYFYLPSHWGLGYGTEAGQALIKFAFSEVNCVRLIAGCVAENIGSERVLLKCGFEREGVLRKHQRLNGTWHDRYLFGLLRPW